VLVTPSHVKVTPLRVRHTHWAAACKAGWNLWVRAGAGVLPLGRRRAFACKLANSQALRSVGHTCVRACASPFNSQRCAQRSPLFVPLACAPCTPLCGQPGPHPTCLLLPRSWGRSRFPPRGRGGAAGQVAPILGLHGLGAPQQALPLPCQPMKSIYLAPDYSSRTGHQAHYTAPPPTIPPIPCARTLPMPTLGLPSRIC